MRSKTPVYSLSRQLLRASWNKYNLFNMSRKQVPSIHNKTMYQQKWDAKKETRAYHGDHIVERKFIKAWDRHLVGVLSDNPRDTRKVPLTSQTYASLERRLDTVIFRSMFASSTRQARQTILHGKVKVNDVQVKDPGYCLKAGDMYEVDCAAVIMNVSYLSGMPTSKEIEESQTATEPSETASEENSSAEPNLSSDATSKRQGAKLAWAEIGHASFAGKAFMSAFAFIPNYLEVDFETCAGVYLRNPVARPAQTDVPSPFPQAVHALAANFYQRGR